ncbi:MAG TPA: sensor histidine kinase [Streptosporangiaceae bacterium]|nr:sensor histidine kinase [Streptosporangiaceae bacterium]
MSIGASTGTFQHGVCVYDDDRQFLEAAVPFLAEGLALGEPTLAVTTPANLELMSAALGKRAGEVDYAESAFFGRRPPQRVAAFYRYWKTRAAARGRANSENGGTAGGPARVRVLAEPVWAGRSAREIAAWTRMESALNVVLAPASISMICPYDARTLGADIVADALCTHPAAITGERLSPSARYADPAAFARSHPGAPLAAPPADAAAFAFDGDLRALRRFISERAAEYGVEGDRADMLVLAVSEVGAYLKRRPPGGAVLRTWEQPGAVVCDFRQPGGSIDDPFLGLRPAELEPGDGDGLWLANQICDWMEIRSGADGCAVQLQVPSRRDQEMVAQPGIRYPA